MKDGHSGLREWCDKHKGCSDFEFSVGQAKCKNQFDYDKFVSYYDGLSDCEWSVVIQAALVLGYDIRSVLYYKKEMGTTFTVDVLPEIIEPLLCMDGASAFVDAGNVVYDCPSLMRQDVLDDYTRWGLPVPEYWKVRLWA